MSLCGLYFGGLGCLADSVPVEDIGSVAVFPGLTGLLGKALTKGDVA